jgi:hypothetical protein
MIPDQGHKGNRCQGRLGDFLSFSLKQLQQLSTSTANRHDQPAPLRQLIQQGLRDLWGSSCDHDPIIRRMIWETVCAIPFMDDDIMIFQVL